MTPQIICDTTRLNYAAELAEAAVRGGLYPSAVLAVANSTETLWTYRVPGRDGVMLDSVFLLASITKPIVATAIMRLVEQGRLLLDVPVATYIPEFAANGKQRVTAWHLLTHTSGLESERWEIELSRWAAPAQAYVEAACRSELRFEPGTRGKYSSLSFWVLAELISRLSGRHYLTYLQEELLVPLAMHNTTFQPNDAQRVAPVHGQPPAVIAYLNTLAAPGGGLWSTAADLVTFGQTLLRAGQHQAYRLLGPATIEEMTRLHTHGLCEVVDDQSRPFHYGLGWRKAVNAPGSNRLGSEHAFGHGGLTGTYLWIDPQWDLVFVFLSNRWGLGHDVPLQALNAVYNALAVRS